MKIVPCTQGEMDWFEARCGRVTGSEVIHAIAIAKIGKNKGGSTEARKAYMASIIGEILTGNVDMEGYATGAMNHGIDEEPRAREVYEMVEDVEVQQVGFVIHPTIERAGASPDGLVREDGSLEIKCPKSKTHIQYVLSGELPDEYEPQVMFEIACTERDWCDFVSYDSRMPRWCRMFMKRIYRNEERIHEINAGVLQFLQETDDTIGEMRRRCEAGDVELPPAHTSYQASPIDTADMPAWMRPKSSPLPRTDAGDVDLGKLADQLHGDILQ